LSSTFFWICGSTLSTPKLTPVQPARAISAIVGSSRQSMRVSQRHCTVTPRRMTSSQISATRFLFAEKSGSRKMMYSTPKSRTRCSISSTTFVAERYRHFSPCPTGYGQ
jgi:hypothetical protein